MGSNGIIRQDPSWVQFRGVWKKLADQGRCDALDGAEYRRVWLAWKLAGKPGVIEAFIVDHANRPPSA